MKILYVCHRIPYPPQKGEKIRAFHQIRNLAKRHDVHLYCLADRRDDLKHAKPLGEFCRTVEVTYLNPLWSRLAALPALFTKKPLTLYYFRSRSLMRKVRQGADKTSFDVAVAYSSGMVPYVLGLGLPVAVDFVDLDSQKWLLYSQASKPPMQWIYDREGRRLFEYELEISKRADVSILVTEEEGRVLREKGSPRRLEAVSLGVDLEFYGQDTPPDDEMAAMDRPILIFVGNMDYRPNYEAAQRFGRVLLPQILKEEPRTLFLVVGANPPASLRALHDGQSFWVTGRVPDTRPYLRAATMSVVPLAMARGIQTKVLEAMAMGLPVVLTDACSRGISARKGRDFLVASDDKAFVRAILDLLRDPARARELGQEGRKFVKEHFAWEDKLIRYEKILEEIAKGSSQRQKQGISKGRVE